MKTKEGTTDHGRRESLQKATPQVSRAREGNKDCNFCAEEELFGGTAFSWCSRSAEKLARSARRNATSKAFATALREPALTVQRFNDLTTLWAQGKQRLLQSASRRATDPKAN